MSQALSKIPQRARSDSYIMVLLTKRRTQFPETGILNLTSSPNCVRGPLPVTFSPITAAKKPS